MFAHTTVYKRRHFDQYGPANSDVRVRNQASCIFTTSFKWQTCRRYRLRKVKKLYPNEPLCQEGVNEVIQALVTEQKRQKFLDETVAIDSKISRFQTAQKPSPFSQNHMSSSDVRIEDAPSMVRALFAQNFPSRSPRRRAFGQH